MHRLEKATEKRWTITPQERIPSRERRVKVIAFDVDGCLLPPNPKESIDPESTPQELHQAIVKMHTGLLEAIKADNLDMGVIPSFITSFSNRQSFDVDLGNTFEHDSFSSFPLIQSMIHTIPRSTHWPQLLADACADRADGYSYTLASLLKDDIDAYHPPYLFDHHKTSLLYVQAHAAANNMRNCDFMSIYSYTSFKYLFTLPFKSNAAYVYSTQGNELFYINKIENRCELIDVNDLDARKISQLNEFTLDVLSDIKYENNDFESPAHMYPKTRLTPEVGLTANDKIVFAFNAFNAINAIGQSMFGKVAVDDETNRKEGALPTGETPDSHLRDHLLAGITLNSSQLELLESITNCQHSNTDYPIIFDIFDDMLPILEKLSQTYQGERSALLPKNVKVRLHHYLPSQSNPTLSYTIQGSGNLDAHPKATLIKIAKQIIRQDSEDKSNLKTPELTESEITQYGDRFLRNDAGKVLPDSPFTNFIIDPTNSDFFHQQQSIHLEQQAEQEECTSVQHQRGPSNKDARLFPIDRRPHPQVPAISIKRGGAF